MVKRGLAAVLLLALILAVAANVGAAGIYNMEIEQVAANRPSVVTYFYIVDSNDALKQDEMIAAKDVAVTLDGEPLEIVSVEKQSDSDEGTLYYYLLDVSTSTPAAVFERVKAGIADQIKEKPDKDKIIVISFGTQVSVVLDGTESYAIAEEKLSKVKPTEDGTRLYDAISKALVYSADENSRLYRNVIMLVTDGCDYSVGATTENEVWKELEKSNIPIYSFGYSGGNAANLNSLGELSRASSGRSAVISRGSAEEQIKETVEFINSAYRVEARTTTNVIEIGGTSEVSIKAVFGQGSYTDSELIAESRWQKDETAPYIVSAEVSDKNTLKLTFSENVLNPLEAESYTLKHGRYRIEVLNAAYGANKSEIILTTSDILYGGKYTVQLRSLTDESMEKNKVTDETFSFEDKGVPKGVGYIFDRLLYIPIILVLLIVAALIFIFVLKKKKKSALTAKANSAGGAGEMAESIYIGKQDAFPVEITIISKNNVQRKVSAVINRSFVIGRSREFCDLGIEDKRLSRQHCALVVENELLSIQDLSSTNGTIVNGIAIEKPRRLESGDRIDIGDTRVIITY